MTVQEENCCQKRVGKFRLLSIVMISLLIVAIIIGVVLVFTLRPQSDTGAKGSSSGTQEPPDNSCIDIAVMGAGIGGTYTSWKLRERGLAISVFEYSDRVGGRFFTTPLPVAPSTFLELGGMRFQQERHTVLTKTAKEIGLNIIPFLLNYGNSDETIWYMRNKHMRKDDIGTSQMPYNLDSHEVESIRGLIRNMFRENTNLTSRTYPTLEDLYSLTTKDGTPVYMMTYDNIISRYASREAYKYLYDVSGWAGSVGGQTALHGAFLYITYPDDQPLTTGASTIEGGMTKVPQTLLDRFLNASTKHKLHLNHQLMRIERRRSGGYNLRFRKTQTKDGFTSPLSAGGEKTLCAKKVIMAASARAIADVDFPVFRNNPEIMRYINSEYEVPAGRAYLAYNSKWWKTNNSDITHTKTDLPNRQTYDWQTGTNNVSILMVSYHDGEFVKYWRELSKFGTPIPGSLPGAYAVTDVVKNRMEMYMSRIFQIKQEDIPPAVGGGMMLWDTYPFYSGWGYMKPGYDGRRVREVTQRPSPRDDVFLISSSWAHGRLRSWSEGSLLAADVILDKYFKP